VVYRLEPLADEDLQELLRRALAHPAGYDGAIRVDDDALEAVAALARGDGRRALSVLEAAVERVGREGDASIDRTVVESIGADSPLLYDRAGDEHYGVVSAFIKSMRGSDPDAAIYWLMRMVEAGDDPLFVLRRMMIFASEDVGNADPRALAVAVDADRAFRRLGMPEGLYAMAQAATYLASAPKSNAATLAWQRARQAVRDHGALPVPLKLRNAPTRLMRDHGYGDGYRYPHDEPGSVAHGETYLPEPLLGSRFYEPTQNGLERHIGERLRRIRSGGAPTDANQADSSGASTEDPGESS
jgi:putative ATPase